MIPHGDEIQIYTFDYQKIIEFAINTRHYLLLLLFVTVFTINSSRPSDG